MVIKQKLNSNKMLTPICLCNFKKSQRTKMKVNDFKNLWNRSIRLAAKTAMKRYSNIGAFRIQC